MRIPLILACAVLVSACTRLSLDHHLNEAYRSYEQGECADAVLELSKAERRSRSRSYLQPEISLLRGQCLERQGFFADAAQTYRFIIERYPSSEYAFRARARLETLSQLGHYTGTSKPEGAPR
jgi:outer membrane protein assembly factor BamD (BamD/ComL family)